MLSMSWLRATWMLYVKLLGSTKKFWSATTARNRRSTRRDRLGSTGDVRIPAGIDGGLTVEAFLRKLRVFGDEVGAETIGRSGRQRRRVVVGHLRLDDVGEACSGPLLGPRFTTNAPVSTSYSSSTSPEVRTFEIS